MPSVLGAVRGDGLLRGSSGGRGGGDDGDDGDYRCGDAAERRARLLGQSEGNWLAQYAALERVGSLSRWTASAFTCPGVCFTRVVPGLRQAR